MWFLTTDILNNHFKEKSQIGKKFSRYVSLISSTTVSQRNPLPVKPYHVIFSNCLILF